MKVISPIPFLIWIRAIRNAKNTNVLTIIHIVRIKYLIFKVILFFPKGNFFLLFLKYGFFGNATLSTSLSSILLEKGMFFSRVRVKVRRFFLAASKKNISSVLSCSKENGIQIYWSEIKNIKYFINGCIMLQKYSYL